ncbi:ribbon-helix-helix domain-containing protein [Pseudoglutamicibacter cumminsii]|uniref:ribbon-helix-helix domain-containing protein n=1 Tax=Pseudoglutamicibacter cumminsii TaxID=156979 RepID=UPI001C633D25
METLRRRGRKPRHENAAKVISIRLSPSEISDLDKYAAAHGWSRSQAIREALRNAV